MVSQSPEPPRQAVDGGDLSGACLGVPDITIVTYLVLQQKCFDTLVLAYPDCSGILCAYGLLLCTHYIISTWIINRAVETDDQLILN